MVSQTWNYGDLRKQILECQEVSGIIELLHELATVSPSEDLDAMSIHYLRLDALEAARQLTSESTADAWDLIQLHLLPFCVDPQENEDVQSGDLGRRYRRTLLGWIDQYQTDDREPLLSKVVDVLVARLTLRATPDACWTLTTLGLRRPDVVASLQEVANTNDNAVGDAALSCLASLGLDEDTARLVLSETHARVTRRFSNALASVLREIGDSDTVQIVQEHWLKPESNVELRDFDRAIALRVPVDVADRFHDQDVFQDEVWRGISDLFESFPELYESDLYLGSDVVTRIDTPDVVADLLRWIASTNAEDDRDRRYRRYLLALRLQECTRPRQLKGWSEKGNSPSVNVLRKDAQRDTKQTGRLTTSESMQKKAAWQILLTMGCDDCLRWFEQAVLDESNAFVRGQVMDFLACFRLDPLPQATIQWIIEPYNVERGGNNHDWAYRTAAIRLARSSPSLQSFDALVKFGLTWDGHVLQESVDALADVSYYLVEAGQTGIVEALLDTIDLSNQASHRNAAAHALVRLASHGLLPSTHAARIAPLIGDNDRDQFERSVLVNVLTFLPTAVVEGSVVSQLQAWASERDDWLGIRSMEYLAHHDYLQTNVSLLSEKLGLEKRVDGWYTRPNVRLNDWEGHIFGALYLSAQQEFAPAMLSLLTDQSWAVAVQALKVLESAQLEESRTSITDLVSRALSQRILNRQTAYSAETGVFHVAGRLCPDILATGAWDRVWMNWLPEARLTLADVLGRLQLTDNTMLSNAILMLSELAQDGHFGVRRSAFRALSRIADEQLTTLCFAWSLESAPRELRLRAAEAIAWIPTEQEQNFSMLYARLAVDIERIVRDQAEKSMQDRKSRQWLQEYLEILRKVETGTNADILAGWCYGEALASVGDDDCAWELRVGLAKRRFLPNHAFWLKGLERRINENWSKITRKWPDPMSSWQEYVEKGQGYIELEPDHRKEMTYTVWYKPRTTLDEKRSWGGSLSLASQLDSWIVTQHFQAASEWKFIMEDGRQALISPRSFAGRFVSFSGLEPYPEEPASNTTEGGPS